MPHVVAEQAESDEVYVQHGGALHEMVSDARVPTHGLLFAVYVRVNVPVVPHAVAEQAESDEVNVQHGGALHEMVSDACVHTHGLLFAVYVRVNVPLVSHTVAEQAESDEVKVHGFTYGDTVITNLFVQSLPITVGVP